MGGGILKPRNQKRRKLVRKLMNEGKSQTEIATFLGVSAQLINYYSSDKQRRRVRETHANCIERKAAELDIDGILKELDEGKFD